MSQNTLDVVRESPTDIGDDWNQYKETLKMLNLAVAQLGLCMKHGDVSVSTIADSFTVMAMNLEEIKDLIPDIEGNDITGALTTLNSKCDHLSDNVNGAIMAFQFYDRLTQNLCHVSENLTSLGDLVTEQDKYESPSEWARLQSDIRSRYTMPEEREMFDMVHKGASVHEAMELVRLHELEVEEEEADIELF